YSLGDYARAKSHYERVLAASPRVAEAWRGLALSEMHLGDLPHAIEHLDRVLEIDPRHADALGWKAEILFETDRAEAALEAAEKPRAPARWQRRAWSRLGWSPPEQGRERGGLGAQVRSGELAAVSDEVGSGGGRLEYAPHAPPLLMRLVELHRSTGNVRSARS